MSEKKVVRLVDRDYIIFKEVDRWRVCLGRHIRELTGFNSESACDRRLRKLIIAGYLERKKILYGVPSIYSLTYKAKMLIHANKRKDKHKIEQILHDIHVLDVAIYLHHKIGLPYKDILTEKQLHIIDGFSNRIHRPDFVFTHDNKSTCVEVELTLKAKARLQKIIQDSFLKYDIQLWVVPSLNHRITILLDEQLTAYSNIQILDLSEVKKYD